MITNGRNESIVVSALRARAQFGKLLQPVEDEQRSLLIEKPGTPMLVAAGGGAILAEWSGPDRH